MKFTKWLLVPMMAFGLFTIGCESSSDTDVVEAVEETDVEVTADGADFDSEDVETTEE